MTTPFLISMISAVLELVIQLLSIILFKFIVMFNLSVPFQWDTLSQKVGCERPTQENIICRHLFSSDFLFPFFAWGLIFFSQGELRSFLSKTSSSHYFPRPKARQIDTSIRLLNYRRATTANYRIISVNFPLCVISLGGGGERDSKSKFLNRYDSISKK